MNSTEKKALAVGLIGATALVLTIKDAIRIKREMRRLDANIEARKEFIAQVEAIKHAEQVVLKNISEGKYTEGGLPAVMNDLKFEMIIARIDITEE